MTLSTNAQNHISLESIQGTIENDGQIYRWFLYLIVQSALRNELIKNSDHRKKIQIIKNLILRQYLAAACFFIGVIVAILVKKSEWLSVSFLGFIWFNYLASLIKAKVIDMSLDFIARDIQPSVLSRMTLYELGEFYGNKYKMPTMVDAMFKEDEIMRAVLIAMIIYVFIIFPFFNFVQAGLILLTGLISIKWMINTSTYYKFLK